MSDPGELLGRRVPAPARTLRYDTHPQHIADLWLPASAPVAVVLFLHGGFWRDAYDRWHAAPLAHALAQQGYLAANVEYRRVGGAGGNPETLDDVARLTDTLPETVRSACELPAGTPTILAGHSAGGHLALWASARHRLPAASPWYRPEPAGLDGILALAAVCDVTAAVQDGIGENAAADLLGGRDNLDQIDPARIGAGATPTGLVHGESDDRVPFEYSLRARDMFAAAATCHRLDLLPDTGHFELIDPSAAAWTTVLEALSWLVDPS